MKNTFLIITLLCQATWSFSQVFIPGADSSRLSVPSDDEIILIKSENDTINDSKAYIEMLAIKDLEQEAQRKVDFLGKYIKQIASKDPDVSRDQKRSAINQALKLFLDEKRIIEVSSKTTGKITSYVVQDYLEHLILLPYTDIEVKWSNIYFAKDLIKVSDNPLIYEGTVSVVQTFKGCYTEGQSCYQDISYKNIIIRVEAVTYFDGENEQTNFIVKLGNTSVAETR